MCSEDEAWRLTFLVSCHLDEITYPVEALLAQNILELKIKSWEKPL